MTRTTHRAPDRVPPVEPALRPARNAVAATFAVHGLLFSSWAAHIPAIARHLRLDDVHLGLTLLGAPVGAVTALVIGGWLLPRVGSRAIVRSALALYCLAGLLVALAGSPLALFGALGAWGCGQGALDVAMNTQAVYVERRAGRPVIAGLHGAWGLGAFLGAGIGTAAVAAGVGLFTQLAVLGLAAFVPTVVCSRALLAEPVRRWPDQPARATSVAGGPGAPDRRQRWSPPPRVLLALASTAFASMLCEGAAADWAAVYLRGTAHATAAVAGLGYTVFAGALLALRLAGNRLLHRVPAGRLVAPLALLAAVGFTAGLIAGSASAMLVGLALLGAGVALIVPTAFGAAGRVPGLHPGRAVATVSGLGWVGFLSGPPLLGALAGATSLRTALGALPVLAVGAAVVSLRALR